MNTIGEILISKNSYKRYTEEICPSCNNKKTNLCKITHRLDNTLKCDNYERCMINKCKTCDKEKECFEDERDHGIKQHK